MSPDGSGLTNVTATPDEHEAWARQQPVFVDLRIDENAIDLGERVTLSGHLHPVAETDVDEVVLLQSIAGGKRTVLRRLSVDPAGDFTFRFRPERHSEYIARWSGDDGMGPFVSGIVEVRVRPRFDASLRGAYGTSGRSELYHLGDPIRWAMVLRPAQSGRPIDVYLEVKRGRQWRDAGEGRFGTGSDGRLTISVRDVPKGQYRLSARFRGTPSNTRATIDPQYFRVTT